MSDLNIDVNSLGECNEQSTSSLSCVIRVFEQHVQQTPDAIALVNEHEAISYAQLAQRTNQLAEHLQAHHVKADDRVGVYLQPSSELIVSILAILKVGAAYVPLDLSYPEQRLSYILNDSNVFLLICEQNNHAKLMSLQLSAQRQVLTLDAIAKPMMKVSRRNGSQQKGAKFSNKLAYIVYTSGSTGRPKGVMVTHQSLTHHIKAISQRLDVKTHDRILQFANIGFDTATEQIFLALLNGACLCIGERALLDIAKLKQCLLVNKITIADLPTSFASELFTDLAKESDFVRNTALRALLVGGETCPSSLVERFQKSELSSQCTLYNAYGPTEATITSSLYAVPKDFSGLSVPIGKTLPETTFYVVDTDMNLLPTGQVGELLIGGRRVALGYWQQEQLTAQQFIDNPFDNTSHMQRLYKTGDLVRQIDDENYEFIGRIDEQVKIRGFRIELGEIEAQLVTHPVVCQAVVIVDKTHTQARLIAYLSLQNTQPSVSLQAQLRAYLQTKLPDYMLPNAWVFMDKLPLTENGKLARKGLPVPEQADDKSFSPPENHMQHQLQTMWAKLLERDADKIGIDDNFLSLGGNSLLASRLLTQLREQWRVELSLKDVLEQLTIRTQADRIKQAESAIAPQIIAKPETRQAPLSYAQQGLWLIDQISPNHTQYHICETLRLSGNVNESALVQALTTVVSRHQILRTVYISQGGAPYQTCLDVKEFTVSILDLQHLVEADAELEIQHLQQQQAQRPFSLEREVLFRAQLVRLAAQHYVLLLSCHHICADGWSINILIKELNTLYQDFASNQAASLAPLPVQYQDYAMWQHLHVTEQVLAPQIAYWQKALSGIPLLHSLPLDYVRPDQQSYRGDVLIGQVDKETTQALNEYANVHNATLFMVLHSALSVLLSRYSGESDIVIGTPVANRTQPQLDDLIGFFANTVVLRSDLSNAPTFEQLLMQNKASTLAAFEHQQLPFNKLVEALKVERSLAYSPVFQVLLVLQNNVEETFDMPDMDVRMENPVSPTAKFDLSLQITPTSEGLALCWEYASDLFSQARIARMHESMLRLLDAILSSPQVPVGALPILAAVDEQRLNRWQGDDKEVSYAPRLDDLFEVQAQAYPNRIAVSMGDLQWSYQALNEQANQLANLLLLDGISEGDLVGVSMARSLNLALSILAILKAGGVYVPLDVDYPEERLRYVIRDANLHMVLCDDTQLQRLSMLCEETNAQVVSLESQSLRARLSMQNPHRVMLDRRNFDTQAMAYVIYTSGSTGKPKGVMQTHRTIGHLVLAQQQQQVLKLAMKTLQLASISFDVSLQELFTTWATGGSLVVLDQALRLEVDTIVQIMFEQGIERVFMSPALLELIAQSALRQKLSMPQLKEVIVAGEALRISKSVRSFWKTSPFQLVNHYGPTESHVITSHVVHDFDHDSAPPIGQPVGAHLLSVLNTSGHAVPVGSIGELWVTGAGLALGYLAQPVLTAEKFVTRASDQGVRQRWYRTGDLVRWSESGLLEFIGRIDQQVQIRGYRVELSEISSVLKNHPMVADAFTLQGGPQSQHLCTFVVLTSQAVPDDEQLMLSLKQWLAEYLPTYMIPNQLLRLDAMLLTHNGKVDRAALLERMVVDVEHELETPKNETEKRLLEIWQALLQLSHISVTDDFFVLGGSSLTAITLTTQINIGFNTQLSVRDIFTLKTIRALANAISHSTTAFKFADYQITPANKEQQATWFPLTNIQQAYLYGRLGNFEMGNVATHCYDEIHFRHLDVEKFEWALNQIIAAQPTLRTVFDQQAQKVLAHIPPYRVIAHGELSDTAFTQVRFELANKVYDVSKFPLFDFAVSQYQGETILHVSIDALIMDATSLNFMFSALAELYNQAPDSQALPQPPALQFSDYMFQYERLRNSELYTQAQAYWQSRLADYNFAVQLPMNTEPSRVTAPTFARRVQMIEPKIWQQLEEKARQYQMSPTSVMLYLYGVVLCQWSGQSSFCINLTLFNRLPLHPHVDELWGDFTVLELFNFQHKPHLSALQAMSDTHQQLWQDIEHNLFDGIDFQRLIRKTLKLDQNRAISPVVLTSLLGQAAVPEKNMHGYLSHGYSITQTSQVYLDNKVFESEQGVVIEWDYVEQLFSAELIEQMQNDYCHLIKQVAQLDWQQALPTLKLPMAHQRLIQAANKEPAPTCDDTLVSLCHKGAAINPHGTAVVDAQGKHSYQSILSRSEQLAHYLHQTRDPQCALIAILSDKGAAQVIASIAIMQTGAAYLPLNVDWPLGRIRQVLSEGQVQQVLVTNTQFENTIKGCAWEHEYQWLNIDTLSAEPQGVEPRAALPNVTPEQLAYVIFTSGSTGKPKGVMISHQGALNTLVAVNQHIRLTQDDAVLALSELSFDLSVFDIFSVLAVGGTIVFPAQARSKEPGHWYELVSQYQVSIWNTVPQLTQLLVDYATDFDLPLTSLRVVMMSGDWIPVSLPSQLWRLNPNIQAISLGGATEGSIWSIWHDINEVPSQWRAIPYGVAMPGQAMYVLNQAGEHCPIGVLGEIYIGGKGVALGYWQDTEKTRAQFIEHVQLGRLYKTGDMGRWHPDGYMCFEGRKDNQVKINGYRIELEEIAAKLTDLAGIEQALVRVKNSQLIAYLIANNAGDVSHLELDDAQTTAFKLKQLGLKKHNSVEVNLPERQLDEALYCSRKSYRTFTDAPISLSQEALQALLKATSEAEDMRAFIEPNNSSVSLLQRLSAVLASISAMSFSDRALPKYRYPSAGSSYAVQTTVCIATAQFGLKTGYYYYHPVNHQLSYLEPLQEQDVVRSAVSLSFALYIPAIKPLYHEQSIRFGYLELGHMLYLLFGEVQKHHLSARFECDAQGFACDGVESVSLGHLHLDFATSAQNNALFPVVSFDYLSRTANGYHTQARGVDFEHLSIFERVATQQQLLESGSALITFSGETSQPQALLSSGYYAQQLSEKLYEQNVGSCCLGFIPYQGVNYTMLVGGIEERDKLASDSDVSATSLTQHLNAQLSQHLPAYMLPQHYQVLTSLPLSANGKVDEGALPEVELAPQTFIAPRNELEKSLAKGVEQTLGLTKVSVTDNFFSLGVDSIVAIKLVAQFKQHALNCTIADIFTYPSIAQLAPQVSALVERDVYQPFSLLDKADLPALSVWQDAYPVSQLQLAMLIASARHDSLYHEMTLFSVAQPFEYEIFEQVLYELSQQHELLRTAFQPHPLHGFIGCVSSEPQVHLTVYDRAIHPIQNELNRQGFMLEQPGLYHVVVGVLQSGSFEVAVLFHHALMDGWSLATLTTQLFETYQAKLQHRVVAHRHALPVYGEYVANQRRAINDATLRDFWQTYLADYEQPELPLIGADRGEPLTHRRLTHTLNSDSADRLVKLSEQLGLPIDVIFLALFGQVLCTFQNVSEFTVGVVANNRLTQQGGDTQIGLFLNTLPIRLVKRKKAQPIGEWLNIIASQKHHVLQGAAMPYQQIIEVCSQGASYLDCVFNYSHFAHHAADVQSIASATDIAKTDFPLALDVTQHDGQFTLSLVVHNQRVERVVAEQLMTYLQHHLMGVVACAQQNDEIDFALSAADSQLLSVQQQPVFASEDSIVSLFCAQVARTPEQLALVYADTQLTYRQLDDKATLLAHVIQQHYLSSGQFDAAREGADTPLIALYFERSVEMVVAMLAVLKAGCAYVPIAIDYPAQRINYVLDNSRPVLVFTQRNQQAQLTSLRQDTPTLCIEDALAMESVNTQALPAVSPRALAYVIYTSGTTGAPKGVMVSQYNVCSLVAAINVKFEINQPMRALQFASYVFDASVFEIFSALLGGHSLFICSDEERKDPQALRSLLVKEKIEWATIAPVVLEQIDSPEDLALKCLITAGESPSLTILKKFAQNCTVYNAYGPTEATVCASANRFSMMDDANNIGTRMHNCQLFVLDDELSPVPVGAVGELYIGGAGVALGYLNQAQLTQQCFIDNPFAKEKVESSERLYKTGDLVKVNPQGELLFLGRSDSQVKVRGHRIELSEIEFALSQVEAVSQAVVIGTKPSSGAAQLTQLHAYVVAEQHAITTEQVLAQLRTQLPPFMLPNTITFISEIPLTINGKVDKQALPEPVVVSQYVAPVEPLACQLCALWQQVLQVERVGVSDNFFALGGDSIRALTLTNQMQALLAPLFQLEDLYRLESVARIVSEFSARSESSAPEQIITI